MTWTCSDCATVHADQFSGCWMCGATRPGFQPARDLTEEEDDTTELAPDLASETRPPLELDPAEQVFYITAESREWQSVLAEFGRISQGLRHRRFRHQHSPRHRIKADTLWSLAGWAILSAAALLVTIYFVAARIAVWVGGAMLAVVEISCLIAFFTARAAAAREREISRGPPAQGAT